MTNKLPIVLHSGQIQQLQTGDTLVADNVQSPNITGGDGVIHSINIYNNATNNKGLTIDTSGIVSSNVTSYENLVTSDNDIPNKKYVDDGLSGKEPTLTKGNLTEATSSILTITNGTNAVIGSGTTIEVQKADSTHSGYISAADWSTFDNKQDDYTTITKEPTGFDVPENVIVNYDSTTQKITLTGTNWVAYWHGEVVSILTNGWVSAAHPDVAGHVYFLSYDGSTSTFSWADNSFPGFDKILIASVNYGATDKYCLRETHGFMQWQTHKELHYTIGTYRESGGTIPSASYTLNSTTATDRRPTIDETVIVDEDLPTTLPALTSKLYTQTFLTGASLVDHTVGAADIISLSTNNPYYNSFSTPNWGQTLMPANSMTSVWIYALPVTSSATSQAYRFLFVQGQWITQAANASAGAKATALTSELLRVPSKLNLGTLTVAAPELVCIARIVIWFTTNWSLASVTQLTGNKFSQIGSPSGNFLSIVATDATLTGNGTAIDPLVVAVPATNADLTATSPILASVTTGVVNIATTISHADTAGNIHLPTGGSSNQILKNSGTSGTGAWGTVTENAGALANITSITNSGIITNNLVTGTAPFAITSTTKVSNLHVERATLADTFTVTNEGTDTTCYPVIVEDLTGNATPRTASGIIYNADTDVTTFGVFPVTPSSAPTTDYQVANKKYVDDTASSPASITMVTANTGTAYTIDLANGTCFNLTLNGNVTFTFPATGTANIMREFWIYLNRDATPNRTITWDADIKWTWNTEPSISTSPYALDDNFSYISGAASTLTIFRFTQLGNSSRWYGEILGTGYTI